MNPRPESPPAQLPMARRVQRENPSPPSNEPSQRTDPTDAEDFSQRILAAENANLRERLARLEASMASWASDLDAASDEAARLREEVGALRLKARTAEDARLAAEAERARLIEGTSLRDSHIADLEARVVAHDMESIEARRTRSRLVAIRKRIRTRLTSQAEEMTSLRRMLSIGHAARQEVEAELAELKMDSERNMRYLDKLEKRLEAAEARAAERK